MNSIAEQGRDGVSKGREGVSSSGRSEQQTGIMNQSTPLSAGGVHVRWWCVCVCVDGCVLDGGENLPAMNVSPDSVCSVMSAGFVPLCIENCLQLVPAMNIPPGRRGVMVCFC